MIRSPFPSALRRAWTLGTTFPAMKIQACFPTTECCITRHAWRVALMLLLAPLAHAASEAVLETDAYRFRMASADGHYEIVDRVSGVTWRSNPWQARFGEATLTRAGSSQQVELSACNLQRHGPGWIASFLDSDQHRSLGVHLRLRPTWSGRGLELSYYADPGVAVRELRLLDDALWLTDAKSSYALVPVREGMRVPSDSGKAYSQRFNTYAYEGCHMAMFGLVQDGAALLATWDDPYTSLDLKSVLAEAPGTSSRQVLLPSLTLRASARTATLHFLGLGDENTIARTYREVAQTKGWLVPWEQKLRHHPERAELFGASNYKLWSTLDRRMTEDSQSEQSVRINWTFEEAAQVAEHLKQDLELDRVLFLMGGWIRRGYDNQHPDILPAAPECGGNEAFAECARRVRALGYVFGLHDNYQDIYRDSPSWDEDLIMKRTDGSLATGGHWAGGRAYLTCSRQAVDLAMRPQNLPAVLDLTGADTYFIDTTYAAGLQECSDPRHPLTLWDDLYWKQAISRAARDLYGIFGSECGREWAIPYSDFFEGLTGVSGRHYHNAELLPNMGAIQVPLFELVYHDTIAMYGKYGYDIRRAADYVLHHVSLGRPLHYHNIPPHLYWQSPIRTEPLALNPSVHSWRQVGDGDYEITYSWNVDTAPAEDWRVFVHFTDVNGRILFQNDHLPATATSHWKRGSHSAGPFRIHPPQDLPDPIEIRVGLFRPPSGRRAQLAGPDDGESRMLVGILQRVGDQLAFTPEGSTSSRDPHDPARFVRADQGWAEGLHPLDRFLKNTHEILGPLNALTAQLPMMRFEFLTDDLSVRRTVFGRDNAITTVINLGNEPFATEAAVGGTVLLPPGGLLVESPTFVAFCASAWNGQRYAQPTLFTLQSLDGHPLLRSEQVRVFHGFGDPNLSWHGELHVVKREAVLTPD